MSEWISVDDGMPEIGEIVVTAGYRPVGGRMTWTVQQDELEETITGEAVWRASRARTVRWWMRLPELPGGQLSLCLFDPGRLVVHRPAVDHTDLFLLSRRARRLARDKEPHDLRFHFRTAVSISGHQPLCAPHSSQTTCHIHVSS